MVLPPRETGERVAAGESGSAAKREHLSSANRIDRQRHPEPSGADRSASLTASQIDFHRGGKVFPLSPPSERLSEAKFREFFRQRG